MLIGEISDPLDAAHEVIGYYNEWVETLPDESRSTVTWVTRPIPPTPAASCARSGSPRCSTAPTRTGSNSATPLLRYAPVTAELYDMALPAWENTNGRSTLVGHRQAYIRSGMAPRGMTPDVVDIYQRFMNAAPSPDSFVVWMHGGGRVSELRPAPRRSPTATDASSSK